MRFLSGVGSAVKNCLGTVDAFARDLAFVFFPSVFLVSRTVCVLGASV